MMNDCLLIDEALQRAYAQLCKRGMSQNTPINIYKNGKILLNAETDKDPTVDVMIDTKDDKITFVMVIPL